MEPDQGQPQGADREGGGPAGDLRQKGRRHPKKQRRRQEDRRGKPGTAGLVEKTPGPRPKRPEKNGQPPGSGGQEGLGEKPDGYGAPAGTHGPSKGPAGQFPGRQRLEGTNRQDGQDGQPKGRERF